MTKQEQRLYWINWSRFQQKYEKVYTNKFRAALQTQVKAYIKTQDLMSVPTFPIYNLLNQLYKSIGPSWAKVVMANTEKAGGMGFNEEIIALMQEYFGIDLLNFAELMTSYSRDIISSVLVNAAQQGWGFDMITEQLLKHPEFNRMRAMRIARTETVTAANTAAVIYAKKSNLVLDKIWIAVKDKRTRHSHKNVDGSVVNYDLPFNVDGTQMMQPGARTQPNGLPVPAQETVNCRCTVAFIPKRDSNGRLLRQS
jgi:hypothetical protein